MNYRAEMKKSVINIPIYGFKLTYIQIEGKEEAKDIKSVLTRLKISKKDIDRVYDNIVRAAVNGGETYILPRKREMLVLIYEHDSEKARRNTVNHELRHVVDRIMEWGSINDTEAAAFLQGWLSVKIY